MTTKKNPADYVIDDDATIEEVDNLDERNITYQGERLTEARLAQISKAAEDAAAQRRAGLVPGGKSLSGDGTHSPVVQVRVSVSTRDKLAAIAAVRQMSVSKLSRQVLDDFVNEQATR